MVGGTPWPLKARCLDVQALGPRDGRKPMPWRLSGWQSPCPILGSDARMRRGEGGFVPPHNEAMESSKEQAMCLFVLGPNRWAAIVWHRGHRAVHASAYHGEKRGPRTEQGCWLVREESEGAVFRGVARQAIASSEQDDECGGARRRRAASGSVFSSPPHRWRGAMLAPFNVG